MVRALEIQSQQQSCLTLSFDERFQLLVDYTYQEKYTNKVKRLAKLARFRFPHANIDDIYYTERGLDRQRLLGIASCQFITTHTSLIFHGFTGSGKSYLACAVGRESCRQGYRTCYIRMPDLLQLHAEASITPTGVAKLLKKYERYVLLILDEWLIDDLTPQQEHFLFELIERRYTESSTIFCTQYRTEDWHCRLGGGIHADAIIDRIIHNSISIYAGDVNMREKQFK
jgi:DNA replication protein DnaC